VTPISTATNTAGPPIPVGRFPDAIAITPNGKPAYVANGDGTGTVTPITTATNTAGPPITVGNDPRAIAITPNGKTAYVANQGSDTVTPISTVTNTAAPPIAVGNGPYAIAIANLTRAHRHQHRRWRRHHPRACCGHRPGQ
jgi:YVTN family beta-propeller protein